MAGTPIGVTDAGGQFDFEGEMQFAHSAVEDLFKNSIAWRASVPKICLDCTMMKIATTGLGLWKLSLP